LDKSRITGILFIPQYDKCFLSVLAPDNPLLRYRPFLMKEKDPEKHQDKQQKN
jgi:hypothetical protein